MGRIVFSLVGLAVIATVLLISYRADKQLVKQAEAIIWRVNMDGSTTFESCSPCFGRARFEWTMTRGAYTAILVRKRDYSGDPWGYTPSGYVRDGIIVTDGKRRFEAWLTSVRQDLRKNPPEPRHLIEYNGDQEVFREMALTCGLR